MTKRKRDWTYLGLIGLVVLIAVSVTFAVSAIVVKVLHQDEYPWDCADCRPLVELQKEQEQRFCKDHDYDQPVWGPYSLVMRHDGTQAEAEFIETFPFGCKDTAGETHTFATPPDCGRQSTNNKSCTKGLQNDEYWNVMHKAPPD